MSGEAEVVVATNAFGMGVDKADIRSVDPLQHAGDAGSLLPGGRPRRPRRPARALPLALFLLATASSRSCSSRTSIRPVAAVYQVYEFLRRLRRRPDRADPRRDPRGGRARPERVGRRRGAQDPRQVRGDREVPAAREHGDRPDQRRAGRDGVGTAWSTGSARRRTSSGPCCWAWKAWSGAASASRSTSGPTSSPAALGLDRPALTRAIHALSAELPIDYVPPFRGNAIRVIDRTAEAARPARSTSPTLEKRKQHEYDKLERMIQYARSRQCRRSFILSYFGERSPACRSAAAAATTAGRPGLGRFAGAARRGRAARSTRRAAAR